MGRVKSALIKNTAKKLLEKHPDIFTGDFEKNKVAAGSFIEQKKLRNSVAGYITRLKKSKNAK